MIRTQVCLLAAYIVLDIALDFVLDIALDFVLDIALAALVAPATLSAPGAAGSAAVGVCSPAGDVAPVAQIDDLAEVCWYLVMREGVQRRTLVFPGLALETFWMEVG